MHNINKPIDKINIGYNKSNEEYIGLMSEKNKLKREIEKSREHQEKLKIKEKEAGFNIHFSGANEERIKEQRRQELLRGNSGASRGQQQTSVDQGYDYNIGVSASQQLQNQKVRRQWKNPGLGSDDNSGQQQQQQLVGDLKYTNPFDLGQMQKKPNMPPMPITGQSSPPKKNSRMRWNTKNDQGISEVGGPVRAIHHNIKNYNNQDDDEEQYSDSFEEDIQQDFEDGDEDDLDNRKTDKKQQYGKQQQDTSDIIDNYGGDGDNYYDNYQREVKRKLIEDDDDDGGQEDTGKSEIEKFLKTATANDISTLRQSMSNFAELAKQLNTKKEVKVDDEDYIEEEFEEQIDSDLEGNNSEEERKEQERLEKQRIEQQRQQQLKTQQTTRGAKNRPISAVYNLESQKIQTQRTQDIPSSYQMPSNNYSQAALKNIQPNVGLQYNYGTQQSQQQLGTKIQETPKQPNDNMKKPVNSNPFKRPFSQNVPKRMEAQNLQNQVRESQQSSATQQIGSNKTQDIGNSQKAAPAINQILSKIEQLDDWQKEKLMEILENLDSLTTSQISQSAKKQEYQQPITQQVQQLDLKFLSPPKAQNVGQSQIYANLNKKEIVLRIIKTYGNPHLCGLTEIELFDQNAKKIILAPAHITPRNIGQGPKIPIARLCDGFKLTNDEKHMWIGYLPMHPQQLELVIQVEKHQEIGGLKIWNYNKSAFDCTKGIKEMQILVNGEEVWQGIIESGKGSTTSEYATFINLIEGINLPREIKEKTGMTETIQEVYEEEESKEQIIQNDNKIDDKEDFMKKYRSEAQLKGQLKMEKQNVDGGPIWLSGSQQSQRTQEQSRINPQSQQRPRDAQNFNTYDLLDKYQFNQPQSDSTSANSGQSQIKNNSQSAVGSARPHPLRENQLQSQSQAQIKPNVGPSSQISNSKNRVQNNDMIQGQGKVDSNNKQWTQPFQAPKQGIFGNNIGQQLQETSDAIQKAVSKVNQITAIQQNQNKNNKPQIVEESLDNLDFFKATNRGRLMNFNDQETKQQEQQKPARKQWGVSPGKSNNSSRLQESQLSGNKQQHKAHVIVKNPFPQKDMTSSGIKQSLRGSQRDDGDYLDQFLSNNSDLSSQLKNPSYPQQNDPIHHIQFGGNVAQQKYGSHQNSQSPIRENTNKTQKQATKTYEDKIYDFSKPFYIPNLPRGQKLEFNILQTWGDMNYVGLAGIEIFDIEGRPVQIDSTQITACPPDINILPGYGGDPRTVDKLVDGHYLTNDDCHEWLTPFTAGEDHTITIELGQQKQISMIRIWNYNKSRIHSYRGARLIECQLDGKIVFRGEIQKAPGNMNVPENCCEIILFTDNDAILQRIDNNDWINDKVISSDLENTQRIMQEVPYNNDERPMTATKKFSTTEIQELQRQLKQQKPTSLFDERPQTSAIITGDQEEAKFKPSQKERFDNRHQDLSNKVRQMAGYGGQIKGRIIEINILESWGDLFYVGLTGIEVWDENGIPINITKQMIDANPRDMNSIQGHGSDYRTLDKLINKINNTTDDHNMWLIPYNKGENHTLKIDLGKITTISAIKFYNYNKSEEDTLRGAKQLTIQVDKKFITAKKGITIMKAPGFVNQAFDMGHLIKLPYKIGWTTEQMIPIQRPVGQLGLFQEYDLINMPMGFQFRINLYSTHGDFYYIGLNGIEFYDQFGNLLKIQTIFAEPNGVNKLSGMENDVRVIQNLINGKNNSQDEINMWLAPFKNTRSYQAVTNAKKDEEESSLEYRIPNYIYVVFDQPTVISAFRLWNYMKTPSRGVNEFEILVDDKQIYRGFAKMASDKQSQEDTSTVVLFTTESKIVDRLKNNINYDPSKQQEVFLFNEKKQMNKNQTKQRPNEEFVFSEMQRPTTMARKY